MAHKSMPGEQQSARGQFPSKDTVYDLLSNKRRRYVIHYLKHSREPVEIGTLAEQIAAWENDTDTAQITTQERKNTYTALQQRHLPRMDDANLIAFDSRAGVVTPREQLEEVDIYTEVVEKGDFPWSQYYLGLSVINFGAVAGWIGLNGIGTLPEFALGVFIVVSFLISAMCHHLSTMKIKLGETVESPEKPEF